MLQHRKPKQEGVPRNTYHIQYTGESPQCQGGIYMNLKTCPFCGSPAEIKEQSYYGRTMYRVSCTKCHCSTELVPTGINLLNNEEITIEAAQSRAVSLWQTRATYGTV